MIKYISESLFMTIYTFLYFTYAFVTNIFFSTFTFIDLLYTCLIFIANIALCI
jgi:hypothetical protein